MAETSPPLSGSEIAATSEGLLRVRRNVKYLLPGLVPGDHVLATGLAKLAKR